MRKLGLEQLEFRIAMDASPLATQLFYEINRARSSPDRFALERRLQVDLTSFAPNGPLAFSGPLTESAQEHAQEMSLANYLAHQSSVDGRWPNQMARDAGYPLASSFPSTSNTIELIAGSTDLTDPKRVLDSWVTKDDRHRNLLFGKSVPFSDFAEAGVGYASNATSDLKNYWSLQAAYQEIGDLFLTGLIYEDRNANQRYDAGEGISGATVTAGPWSTQSGPNGEWSIEVSGGRHTITASGPSFTKPQSLDVAVTTENVEVDFLINKSIQHNFRNRSNWTNPDIAEDVNGDDSVIPLDALIVINKLNQSGIHQLPDPTDSLGPPPFYDASGDGLLSPLDALIIINYLNARV